MTVSGTSGEITSEGYMADGSGYYANAATCTWIISVTIDYVSNSINCNVNYPVL